jgi:hypothetical protein
MSGGDPSGPIHVLRRALTRGAPSSLAARFGVAQPQPQAAGYILVLAAGAGVSVAGALLPAHLSWWWLDTAGHVIGGGTLALGLLILTSRVRTAIGVIILSVLWEAVEWTVGYPFYVTVADTRLDLLAGWVGLAVVLCGSYLRAVVCARARA